MPKQWKPGQENKFCRELELNKPYYIVYTSDTRRVPYEDAQVYSEIVFTRRRRLLAEPITEHGADASTILRQHGPVYDSPPRGMRNITDVPQVAPPLGNNNYEGVLDEAELRGLEKQAAQTSNPRTRRPAGSWRL